MELGEKVATWWWRCSNKKGKEEERTRFGGGRRRPHQRGRTERRQSGLRQGRRRRSRQQSDAPHDGGVLWRTSRRRCGWKESASSEATKEIGRDFGGAALREDNGGSSMAMAQPGVLGASANRYNTTSSAMALGRNTRAKAKEKMRTTIRPPPMAMTTVQMATFVQQMRWCEGWGQQMRRSDEVRPTAVAGAVARLAAPVACRIRWQ